MKTERRFSKVNDNKKMDGCHLKQIFTKIIALNSDTYFNNHLT